MDGYLGEAMDALLNRFLGVSSHHWTGAWFRTDGWFPDVSSWWTMDEA